MPESSLQSTGKLALLFSKINMSELPAMSGHVQELLELTSGKRSANYDDLAKIILKDFSLTNKVLQCANSAYYALGQKVSTVSMAVAALGFDTVRDLAVGIALFDDFVKAGVDAEEVGRLLSRSFLAALLARGIAESRQLRVLPEEAFICALMRNLGKIITCIYLPAAYKGICEEMADGASEGEAAQAVLDGLTFAQVGREVGFFWNLTENVIKCMEPDPGVPEEDYESEKYLHCIVDFSNRFVEELWSGKDIEELMDKYSYSFSIDEEEAAQMLSAAVSSSKVIFDSIRPGVVPLDFRSRLKEIESGQYESDTAAKDIERYWREINEMIAGSFNINDFFSFMLEALCWGLDVDRALLAMVHAEGDSRTLVGKLGFGDVTSEQVRAFRVALDQKDLYFVQSFTSCKDMALTEDRGPGYPEDLQDFVKGRRVYLFPVSMKKRGVALLYLDRVKEKNKLDITQIKYVRMFRNLAEKVTEMKRKSSSRRL